MDKGDLKDSVQEDDTVVEPDGPSVSAELLRGNKVPENADKPGDKLESDVVMESQEDIEGLGIEIQCKDELPCSNVTAGEKTTQVKCLTSALINNEKSSKSDSEDRDCLYAPGVISSPSHTRSGLLYRGRNINCNITKNNRNFVSSSAVSSAIQSNDNPIVISATPREKKVRRNLFPNMIVGSSSPVMLPVFNGRVDDCQDNLGTISACSNIKHNKRLVSTNESINSKKPKLEIHGSKSVSQGENEHVLNKCNDLSDRLSLQYTLLDFQHLADIDDVSKENVTPKKDSPDASSIDCIGELSAFFQLKDVIDFDPLVSEENLHELVAKINSKSPVNDVNMDTVTQTVREEERIENESRFNRDSDNSCTAGAAGDRVGLPYETDNSHLSSFCPAEYGLELNPSYYNDFSEYESTYDEFNLESIGPEIVEELCVILEKDNFNYDHSNTLVDLEWQLQASLGLTNVQEAPKEQVDSTTLKPLITNLDKNESLALKNVNRITWDSKNTTQDVAVASKNVDNSNLLDSSDSLTYAKIEDKEDSETLMLPAIPDKTDSAKEDELKQEFVDTSCKYSFNSDMLSTIISDCESHLGRMGDDVAGHPSTTSNLEMSESPELNNANTATYYDKQATTQDVAVKSEYVDNSSDSLTNAEIEDQENSGTLTLPAIPDKPGSAKTDKLRQKPVRKRRSSFSDMLSNIARDSRSLRSRLRNGVTRQSTMHVTYMDIPTAATDLPLIEELPEVSGLSKKD